MAVAFTAPQDVLLRLVNASVAWWKRRNTIPDPSNVLVTANGDGSLAVEGTDLDIWLRMESEPGTATVATPGSTTVPAALLTEILRKTGKAEIAFKSDERFATLTANRSRFASRASPVDFPDDVRNQGRPRDQLRALAEADAAHPRRRRFRHLDGGDALLPQRRLPAWRRGRGFRETRNSPPSRPTATACPASPAGRGRPRRHEGHHRPEEDDRPLQGNGGLVPEGERVEVTCDEARITFRAGGFHLVSKLIDGTFPTTPASSRRTTRNPRRPPPRSSPAPSTACPPSPANAAAP